MKHWYILITIVWATLCALDAHSQRVKKEYTAAAILDLQALIAWLVLMTLNLTGVL